MARMKRDMAKQGERMDSMDATLKGSNATLQAILERLTTGKRDATAGGTTRAAAEMEGGEAPVAAEGPHDATRWGGLIGDH